MAYINGVYQVGTNQNDYSYGAANPGYNLQGSAPSIQGSSPYLQGSQNTIQVTAPSPQQTWNPQAGQQAYLGPSQAEIDAANAERARQQAEQQRIQTTNTINSTFAAPVANFDALYADLDRTKAFNEGQIESQYGTSRGGLDLSYNQGTENLNKSQAGVDYTKSSSLRELGSNLDSAMRARLSQIGAKGAGSSSAGYQLAMGIHDTGDQARGSLIDQAGQQYGAIDLSRKHLGEQHDQAIKQLDDWKIGEIAKITNDYLTSKAQLDREKAGADASRQAALAAQSVTLAQQAAANLAQVQNTVSTTIAGMKANTAGGQAVNDRYAPGMSSTNYKVNALEGANPDFGYQGPTSPTSMTQFSPFLLPRRTNEQY